MKLHDLRPAPGAHTPRTRVGRGIAAGKGKTAGRGTKGQKARAGGTINAWFEGGQTPIHIRIPKLRGFRNAFRIEYEAVNVGRLAELAESGVLSPESTDAENAGAPALVTITPDILAAVGLVRHLDRPLKILGGGEVNSPLFVVADAFTKSAAAKIEAAGGTAQVLVFPTPQDAPADFLAPTLPDEAAAEPAAEPTAGESSESQPAEATEPDRPEEA